MACCRPPSEFPQSPLTMEGKHLLNSQPGREGPFAHTMALLGAWTSWFYEREVGPLHCFQPPACVIVLPGQPATARIRQLKPDTQGAGTGHCLQAGSHSAREQNDGAVCGSPLSARDVEPLLWGAGNVGKEASDQFWISDIARKEEPKNRM